MLNYKLNKKAEIGETATWLVATIIIIGIVLVAIWISFLISKTKAIAVGDIRTDIDKDSVQLEMKTSLAEQLNNKDKSLIEDTLRKQNAG